MKDEIKNLKEQLKLWKKAYYELDYYFDSISDEEKPKVWKRLQKIFTKIEKYETSNK